MSSAASQQKTIAFDIDDVIARSTDALRRRVNERTGAKLTLQQYHEVGGAYRRYYDRVWEKHGLSDKINFKDIAAEMVIDQSHISPEDGMVEVINQLGSRFELVFITARPADWEEATRRWLLDNLGRADVKLYFCDSVHDSSAKTKGQICKELGASWLIDDSVDHCQSARDEGIEAILFGSYGWHVAIPEGMVHCKNWTEVMRYFDAGR